LGGQTERDFKDAYRNNVAAYRLARLIGIRTVRVSVERGRKTTDAVRSPSTSAETFRHSDCRVP
jgi:hypothetical protein